MIKASVADGETARNAARRNGMESSLACHRGHVRVETTSLRRTMTSIGQNETLRLSQCGKRELVVGGSTSANHGSAPCVVT